MIPNGLQGLVYIATIIAMLAPVTLEALAVGALKLDSHD